MMKKLKIYSVALLLLVLVGCALLLFSCDAADPCAKGHTEVVDAAVPATCAASGLAEGKHCSVCNKILTAQEKTEKLAHTFGDWTVTVAPTCTSKGSQYRVCTQCKEIETQVLDAHSFENWTTVKVASCGQSGLKTSTCTECGMVKEEITPALTHLKSETWEKLQETSCLIAGKEGRKCTLCSAVMEIRDLPSNSNAHVLVDDEILIPATCTSEGLKTLKCVHCSHTQQATIAMLSHTPGTPTVSQATCTLPQTSTTVCTSCGHTEVETLSPATGHEYLTADWVIDVPSTCFAVGTKHCECHKCGQLTVEDLPEVEHSFGQWSTVSTASCTQNGEKQRTCNVCSSTESQILPATDHTQGAWTTLIEATDTHHGSRTQECSVCHAVINTEVIPSSNPMLIFSYLVEGNTVTITGYGPYAAAELVIPTQIDGKNVTKIAKGAFAAANRFTSISLPSTLQIVEAGAFDNCSLVTKSNGLYYVDNWIVGADTSLTELTIAANVLGIAEGIFANCPNLNTFTVDGNSRFAVANNYLYNTATSTLLAAKKNITGSLSIPTSIKAVADGAFTSCFALHEITIPSSVTRVGATAFAECYTLVRVMNLSGLNITLPANPGMEKKTSGSFSTTLTSSNGITLYKPNNSTTYMLGYTGSSSVLDLTGKGVTAIYQYALCGNTVVKELTIPSTIAALGKNALANCPLEKAALHMDFVPELCYTHLKSLKITGHNDKNEVPSNLLSGCTTLEELELPNTLLISRKGAFAGCTGVKILRAPANALAALSLTNLEELYITGGTVIGSAALRSHIHLKSVTIAASVTDIKGQAFYLCAALETVTFASGSQLKNLEANAFCSTALKSINLPEGLETIGSQCFSSCSQLTSVTLPSTVIEIKYQAFAGTPITSITIPASVRILGQYGGDQNARGVFQGCSSLATVTFAGTSNLTLIGNHCFYGCTALKSITIPASVTHIGKRAFGDSGVSTITFSNTSGWKRYSITNYGGQVLTDGFQGLSGGTAITVTNTATNATNLENTYKDYVWMRG